MVGGWWLVGWDWGLEVGVVLRARQNQSPHCMPRMTEKINVGLIYSTFISASMQYRILSLCGSVYFHIVSKFYLKESLPAQAREMCS